MFLHSYIPNQESQTRTSTFCKAFVGSGGGVREADRPLGAGAKPNFTLCSEWFSLLLDE
jgi:hypothetical protein